MKQENLNSNEELIKAIVGLGIPIDTLVDDDIEKAGGMSSDDYDKMEDEEKAGYIKKGDMYFKKPKDDEKDKIEKAKDVDKDKTDNTDLVKAIADLKEDLHTRDEDLVEKAVAAVEGKFTKRIEELEEVVNGFSEQRPGKKTVTNAQFLSKGPAADEDGNTSLSMVLHKSKIEKAIEDLIEDEKDDEIQKGMENELLILNTNPRGDADLSQLMTDKLLTEKKIKVIK